MCILLPPYLPGMCTDYRWDLDVREVVSNVPYVSGLFLLAVLKRSAMVSDLNLLHMGDHMCSAVGSATGVPTR